MQKIVTIGGGTGHYQILSGLRSSNYDCDLTAIVNVCDNGGHSGELRIAEGVLPPGDSRQCLLALADEESAEEVSHLFHVRSASGESLGNSIIAALEKKYGRANGLKRAAKLLHTKGRVFYVSTDSFHIMAELEGGTILNGQNQVSYPKSQKRIKRITTDTKPFVQKDSAEALRQAHKIVICPGDLYGSIIPNFLVDGVSEAIQASNAILIYVCNLVTKEGTRDFKTSDFVAEIEKYLGSPVHKVIVNTKEPKDDVKKGYLGEFSKLVENDMFQDPRIVTAGLLEEYISEGSSDIRTIVRHEPELIAREIMAIARNAKD